MFLFQYGLSSPTPAHKILLKQLYLMKYKHMSREQNRGWAQGRDVHMTFDINDVTTDGLNGLMQHEIRSVFKYMTLSQRDGYNIFIFKAIERSPLVICDINAKWHINFFPNFLITTSWVQVGVNGYPSTYYSVHQYLSKGIIGPVEQNRWNRICMTIILRDLDKITLQYVRNTWGSSIRGHQEIN